MKVAGLQGLTGSHRATSVRFPRFLFLMPLLCIYVHAQQKTNSTLEGKRIFSANCAACHGLDGQGSERGPDIANNRALQRRTDQALSRIVREGVAGTGMPAFRSLGASAIQAVVHHLRQLQGQATSEPLPGDPKAGQTLFFGKAECSQCHLMNGEGGFIGSDLSSYANGRHANEVRDAITVPNKNLDPRKSTVVVTTADGKTYRGIARNEDNFSLQMQTIDGAFHLFNKSELQSFEYQPQSLMPADYGIRLTRREIDDLVSYLIDAGRNHKQQKSTEDSD